VFNVYFGDILKGVGNDAVSGMICLYISNKYTTQVKRLLQLVSAKKSTAGRNDIALWTFTLPVNLVLPDFLLQLETMVRFDYLYLTVIDDKQ
jgi:hypothetical protein